MDNISTWEKIAEDAETNIANLDLEWVLLKTGEENKIQKASTVVHLNTSQIIEMVSNLKSKYGAVACDEHNTVVDAHRIKKEDNLNMIWNERCTPKISLVKAPGKLEINLYKNIPEMQIYVQNLVNFVGQKQYICAGN